MLESVHIHNDLKIIIIGCDDFTFTIMYMEFNAIRLICDYIIT